MNTLEDKVAYITGGSKGIGLGVAKALLEQGMRVAVTSRSLQAAQKAVQESGFSTDRFLAVESDVSDYSSEQKAVSAVLEKFGKIDVVVANAGVGHLVPFEEMSTDLWKETIDTNLTGVFNTVKASLAALKDSEGYVITIASLAGTNFFENGTAYNASKFGLVGFSQALMLDVRKYGIKVTTIMPGSVATQFGNHEVSEKDA